MDGKFSSEKEGEIFCWFWRFNPSKEVPCLFRVVIVLLWTYFISYSYLYFVSVVWGCSILLKVMQKVLMLKLCSANRSLIFKIYNEKDTFLERKDSMGKLSLYCVLLRNGIGWG